MSSNLFRSDRPATFAPVRPRRRWLTTRNALNLSLSLGLLGQGSVQSALEAERETARHNVYSAIAVTMRYDVPDDRFPTRRMHRTVYRASLQDISEQAEKHKDTQASFHDFVAILKSRSLDDRFGAVTAIDLRFSAQERTTFPHHVPASRGKTSRGFRDRLNQALFYSTKGSFQIETETENSAEVDDARLQALLENAQTVHRYAPRFPTTLNGVQRGVLGVARTYDGIVNAFVTTITETSRRVDAAVIGYFVPAYRASPPATDAPQPAP